MPMRKRIGFSREASVKYSTAAKTNIQPGGRNRGSFDSRMTHDEKCCKLGFDGTATAVFPSRAIFPPFFSVLLYFVFCFCIFGSARRDNDSGFKLLNGGNAS